MEARRAVKRIFERAGIGIATLFLLTVASFLLTRLSPIDLAEAYIRLHTIQVTPEALSATRAQLGLNDPLPVQYANWLRSAARLDFGASFVTGSAVFDEFLLRVPRTARLMGLSALMQAAGALLLGSALYLLRDGFSGKALQLLALCGLSIPPFLTGIAMLDLFAMRLRVTSVLGAGAIFPALCAAVIPVCFFGKMLKTDLSRHMRSEWAEYARLRGLSVRRILLGHAMPHSVSALIPSFFKMLGKQFAGVGIVETVFSYRGIGNFIIEGIVHHDAPVINASILFLALAVLAADLLAGTARAFMGRGGRRAAGEAA
jgi:ABC-type dipeptide/oligopeptide/nickel transport system permease component